MKIKVTQNKSVLPDLARGIGSNIEVIGLPQNQKKTVGVTLATGLKNLDEPVTWNFEEDTPGS